MSNRVVVTGMGTINPIGTRVDEFFENIKAGKCGIGDLTLFDASDYPVKIAGEVKNFDPSDLLTKKQVRSMARFSQFATYASIQAMEMAGFDTEAGVPDDIEAGVYIGNGIGGFEIAENNLEKLFQRGPRAISPLTIPLLIENEAAANIALIYKVHGPCITVSTACASGTDAIGTAFLAVKNGLVDMAITGGTEGAISQLSVGGFARLHALSASHNDEPQKACCPFDKNRDGFTIGEGAGMLVIETLEGAKKRGANILGEIVGYGASCDAYHITAPEPSGVGAARAMEKAIKMAGIKKEDIDYINAHGTSTKANDVMETNAIKLVFGDLAKKLKVSSTKGMTSHLVGAAGAVESIVCIKAINEGYYPATINYETPDEECDLDYVPNKGIEAPMKYALNESLGFGGHNGVLIFKKFED
ncbi:MAG: beta-ketoacyl-ACP synthase II [Sphaerochaeta sp.]